MQEGEEISSRHASSPTGSGSPPDPKRPLFTRGRRFSKDDPIVATTVYHWFTPEAGQLSGPWPPLGGRKSWTGTPDWWKDQLKQIMLANFDVIYVHLTEMFEEQRVTLFEAYAALRADGYDPPKIAPFLDPLSIWQSQPIDVATPQGKDVFTGQYIRFFRQYFATNKDPFSGSYLAHIDDKLLLASWWATGILVNLDHLQRGDVEQRLADAFPGYPEFLDNGIWMASTALIEPDFSFSDERAVMFSGLHYFVQCTHNGIRTYHLQAGYSDQNIRRPGLFMPRAGGRIYRNVWDYAIETSRVDVVHRYYIESWNEYDEGSGIYAADTDHKYVNDENAAGSSDEWSSTSDPFEYIHTTRLGASQVNGLPNWDSNILAYQSTLECVAGGICEMRFEVRNQGNALWTSKDGVGFGMLPTSDAATFEYTVRGFDSDINELNRFGGVFRGRPVEFVVEICAPSRSAIYKLGWSMFREENGIIHWFGEEAEVTVAVKVPPVGSAVTSSVPATEGICGVQPVHSQPSMFGLLSDCKMGDTPVKLSRESVIWGYRYLLGREPESEAVIRDYMESETSVQGLRQTLMKSAEFKMQDVFFEDLRCYPGFGREDLQVIDQFMANPQPSPGFLTDFIGSRTRITSLWNETEPLWGSVYPKPLPGDYHADAVEWVGVLKSVLAAQDRFTAMELGAGYGPWVVAGAVAARTKGIKDIRLVGVEADPRRFEMMQQHFRDNNLDPNDHMLVQAGVGVAAGKARWPRFEDPRNNAAGRPLRTSSDGSTNNRDFEYLAPWAGDAFIDVEIVAFDDLLLQEPIWDLVHIDVQGTEVELCQASRLLSERVRYIVVGTHSRKIDGDLLVLMDEAGWVLEHEKPTRFVFKADCRSLELMTVNDGTQVWRNPRI